jgi:hypothetical protein
MTLLAVLAAGPVLLAVAVPAVPARIPPAIAADAAASSTRRAARAPGDRAEASFTGDFLSARV